ncbi:conserved hypothetical protein, secreted, partial [mine drainage metagenome]
MSRPILTVMVLIAAILAAPVALAAHRTYAKQFSAPNGGRLTLHTQVGSVHVIGAQTRNVTIRAQLTGTKSFLNSIHIHAEQTPTGVTISAHIDHREMHHWFHFIFFARNHVRFTIEVPRDYPVDLRTSGGDIGVRDLNASVHAASSGGDISIAGVAGKIGLHTAGGDIQVKNDNGAANMSSAGGDIDIADSTGALDLRTGGGDIRLRNDTGKIQGFTAGGGVWARLRANDGVSFSSGGGDIDVLLPRNVGAALDARSNGGSLTSEFPLSTTRIKSDTRLS